MKYNRRLFKFNSARARRTLSERGYPLLDKYNGRFVFKSHQWHVEHVLPLKTAWDAGFKQQFERGDISTMMRMQKFANDMDNLIVVSGGSNMSRGSKTLWEWSPLNLAYIPERNRIIRLMADRYGLELTTLQQWSMDFADKAILGRHKNGLHLGRVRSWLIERGFYRLLLPF